jgi:hypothetical protein
MPHGKVLSSKNHGHMQRTSMGAALALFCRNLMEVCEARRHGSETKKMIKVDDFIMQLKVWL